MIEFDDEEKTITVLEDCRVSLSDHIILQKNK